jgi:hypothetical protein
VTSLFESRAFGIVRLEPTLGGFGIGEGLDVIRMADAILVLVILISSCLGKHRQDAVGDVDGNDV